MNNETRQKYVLSMFEYNLFIINGTFVYRYMMEKLNDKIHLSYICICFTF